MSADDIFKAHGIPVVYSFYPVDKYPLYIDAPFDLMLFRGQKESDTLKGDFMLAVSDYVQHDMFNEYVDVSQPLFHLVIKGDTNSIKWVDFKGSKNMQYKEYDIYADKSYTIQIGKLAIFMGGLFKESPFQWMNKCVDSYIASNIIAKKYVHILNLVETTMDNPWVRVVFLSQKKMDNLFK